MVNKKEVTLDKYEVLEEIGKIVKAIEKDIKIEDGILSVNNILVNDLEVLLDGLGVLDPIAYIEVAFSLPEMLKQLLSSGLIAKDGKPTEEEIAYHLSMKYI